jgi:hypothetical protein
MERGDRETKAPGIKTLLQIRHTAILKTAMRRKIKA